jgi:hypothetical protein
LIGNATTIIKEEEEEEEEEKHKHIHEGNIHGSKPQYFGDILSDLEEKQ